MLFALLLFLVCAVLSAVILTAATASTGRLSGMADTDARYYAVTSAVDLVSGELENSSVTLVRTKSVVTTKTVRYTQSGSTYTETALADVVGEPAYETVLNGRTLTASSTKNGMSFLEQAAMDAVFGATGAYVGESAWDSVPLSGGSASSYSYTLKHDGGAAPDVAVTAKLADNGTLTVTFSNADGGEKYTLILTMDLDIYEDTETVKKTSSDPVVTTNGTGRDEAVDQTVTNTKRQSMRWVVRNVTKG